MSNGESDIRDARDPTVNPAVKITILFEEGNGLVWKLEKPWTQAAMFTEIGMLAASYELGIEFEFPVGDETTRRCPLCIGDLGTSPGMVIEVVTRAECEGCGPEKKGGEN